MLNSRIAKDAFQAEAKTSQKELKQDLETSKEGLGEKLKIRRENTTVYQLQMAKTNVPIIE